MNEATYPKERKIRLNKNLEFEKWMFKSVLEISKDLFIKSIILYGSIVWFWQFMELKY